MNVRLSQVDVKDFLNELGVRNVKDEGSEVKYSCPFPGHSHGDANPSATMQKGTTVAHCFGCGWSGNALTFLAQYEGVNILKAGRWIRERFGDGFREPESGLLSEVNEILASKPPEPRRENAVLDEEEVVIREVDWHRAYMAYASQGDLPAPFFYMFERGFDPDTLESWQIGWDAISQRLSIPVRNDEGGLVGFKARSIDEEPKYKVLGGRAYGFEPYEVSRVLFGLDRARNYVNAYDGWLIVTEGELNAMACHQRGHRNACGFSGRRLSDIQAQLVRRYARGAVIITDDDEDALRAASKLYRYIPTKIVPPHSTDPADMNREELYDLIRAAEPATLVVP